jgi:hypothetical protein
VTTTATKLTAHWIEVGIVPGSPPPCELRVGVRDDGLPRVFRLPGVTRIAEGVDRALAALAECKYALASDFMLVYPRYAVEDELENTMHELAWLVLNESQRRGWRFGREVPQPTMWF